jgi:hypothetical protein
MDDIATTAIPTIRAPLRAFTSLAWLRGPTARDRHRRLEAEIARLIRRIDEGDTPSTADLVLLRGYLRRSTLAGLDD